MPIPSRILTDRAKSVFITEEAIPGTPQFPSVSDFLSLAEVPSYSQMGNYTTLSEIRPSLTPVGKVYNYTDYGSLNLATYSHPAGTAGAAPGEASLLKAICGKLIGAGTSLSYPASAATVSTVSGVSKVVLDLSNAGFSTEFRVGDRLSLSSSGSLNGKLGRIAALTTSGTGASKKLASLTIVLESTAAADATAGTLTLLVTRAHLQSRRTGTYSVWIQTDDYSLDCLAGVFLETLKCSLQKDGAVKFDLSAKFARQFSAGTMQSSTSTLNKATSLSLDTTAASGLLSGTLASDLYFAGQYLMAVEPSGRELLSTGAKVVSVGTNSLTISNIANQNLLTLRGTVTNISAGSATSTTFDLPAGHKLKVGDLLRCWGTSAEDANADSGTLHANLANTLDLTVTATTSTSVTASHSAITALPTGAATGILRLVLPATTLWRPWLPTGASIGTLLEQRNAGVYLAAKNKPLFAIDANHAENDDVWVDASGASTLLAVTSFSLTLTQKVQTPGLKELNATSFPPADGYLVSEREISGDLQLMLRPKDMARYQQMTETPERALALKIGNTPGRLLKFYMPNAHFNIPEKSASEGAPALSLKFNLIQPAVSDTASAVGGLGEDEELCLIYE